MKKSVFFSCGLLVLFLLGMVSCSGGTVDALKTVTLSGPQTAKEISLSVSRDESISLVSDINFQNPDAVAITVLPVPQGESPHVSAVYPSDFEDYGFYIKEENGSVTIGTAYDYRYRPQIFSLTIYAAVDTYDLSGACTLHADGGGISAASLKITIAGAVEADFTGIHAETVTVDISGAADLEFEGNADTFSGVMRGAGDVDAADMPCKNAVMKIEGAGAAELSVTDTLDVTISGAGSVTYHGSPTVTKTIEGFGSVTPLDIGDGD